MQASRAGEQVDWFNNRRLLESNGKISPAEAVANFYTALETEPMAGDPRQSASGKPGALHMGIAGFAAIRALS